MKYLLDTCVLIWALEANKNKLNKFLDILEDQSNDIIVSVVSKKSIGKLVIPDNLKEIIEQTGFSILNLEYPHIEQLQKLPMLHTDPFDRLLIAQSIVGKYKLLTVDEKIFQYQLSY